MQQAVQSTSHIPWSQILSIVATAVGAILTMWLATLRYAYNERQKKIDEKFKELDDDAAEHKIKAAAEHASLRTALNEEEKKTIRMEGKIQLLESNHSALSADIEEIKDKMVTKAEWEPRMSTMERTLTQILGELRGISGRRYPTPPPDKR